MSAALGPTAYLLGLWSGGFALLRAARFPPALAAAAALPLGGFLAGYAWFLLALAGRPLSPPLVAATLLLGLSGLPPALRGGRPRRPRGAPAAPLLGFLLLAAFLYEAGRILATPYLGDGLSFWRPKALYLAAAGTPRTPVFLDPRALHLNPHYPLLWPYLLAGLRVLAPDLPPLAERALAAALFLSLGGLVYALLRTDLGPTAARLLTALFYLAVAGRFYGGYATLPMAVLGTAFYGSLLRWRSAGGGGAALVTLLVGAALVFTKEEGKLYLAAAALALLWGRQGRAALVLGGGVLVLALPWLLFQRELPVSYRVDLPGALHPAALREELRSVPYLLGLLPGELLAPERWGLLWALAGWAALRTRPGPAQFPTLAFLGWAFLVVLIPWRGPFDPYFNGVERWLGQLAGPAVLLVGRAWGRREEAG